MITALQVHEFMNINATDYVRMMQSQQDSDLSSHHFLLHLQTQIISILLMNNHQRRRAQSHQYHVIICTDKAISKWPNRKTNKTDKTHKTAKERTFELLDGHIDTQKETNRHTNKRVQHNTSQPSWEK